MKLKQYIKRIKEECWVLGFVRGGMEAVMESDQWVVDWVYMPKDRWFADPFVLDVTDEEILLLVEDFGYDVRKGVISLLHINRTSMEITSRKVLLDQPYHLSFPAIWRKDGHVYVYPESACGGQLDLYEFDAEKEELTFVKTICDDVIWDSYITEAFGEPLMFTSAHEDDKLEIYRMDEAMSRYVPWQEIVSKSENSRMGGAVFEYKGQMYYPAQNSEITYGGSIDIKRINYKNNTFSFDIVKHIESPSKRYPMGLHTLNVYKGVVVIDVKGYRFRMLGRMMAKMINLKNIMKI